jgi:sorting nexin-25
MPSASWAVARRYSEFHDLHHRLRRRYPSVRNLEFPRRRVVMKLQKEFLHRRRVALEAYLQQLLRLPDVCRSWDLRAFLSQADILPTSTDVNGGQVRVNTNDIVTRIYNSVTDGMDDVLGNLAALDNLSAAGQSLIAAATSTTLPSQSQTSPTSSSLLSSPAPASGLLGSDSIHTREAEAELLAYSDDPSLRAESAALEPFVKPIADLFLETFDLTSRGQNWLRGRAVVVVLHQLLGGTIERKTRDLFRAFTAPDSVVKYITMVREIMWPLPEEKLREAATRTKVEKEKSKKEASVCLATLVPDLAGSVVGRQNAKEAARRLASAGNNGRLMEHLVYEVLDEVVGLLFADGMNARGR